MGEDVGGPVVVGVVAVAASMGVFFWRSHVRRSFAKMESATRRHPTSFEGEAYMALRGVVSSPLVYEADYAGEKTVVSRTVLRHRWAERTVTIEVSPRVGGRDKAQYSQWEQKEELVNEPVFRAVAFSVIHTDRRAAAGNVAVAVKVDCDATALPLVVRFSQSLEEKKKSSVNVSNSNTSTPALSGTREVRELGTLREESILPLDRQLTVFGYVRRDYQGDLTVSDAGCSGEEPFLASFDSPATILATKQHSAKLLLIGGSALAVVSLGAFAYAIAKQF